MPLTMLKTDEILRSEQEHDCAGLGRDQVCVRIAGVADLPSRFGEFQIVAFWNNRDDKEHVALVHGDVSDQSGVPVRVHSECLTGDVLGSLRCDCRDQLEAALKLIGQMERGVLLYLRQEGRGIGLINKIRAYSLQDRGFDTVEANLALGFRDEERDFAVAAHMIQSLRIRSVKLMTNNPYKINELEKNGVVIEARLPHELPPNPHNRFYLETKLTKMGHYLDIDPASARAHIQPLGDEQGEKPSPQVAARLGGARRSG
jgi:GTP cyclohydrolase II